MKRVALVALFLACGVAAASAQDRPVKMKFSGSMVPTSIAMQESTITDEELLAGDGALGAFTFRKLRTDTLGPVPSTDCAGLNIGVVAGGGVFRFADGSLLTVAIVPTGSLCINLQAAVARLTETYQVTGGTGRFKNVTGGTLNLTATLRPALFSSFGQAVLLTSTAVIEGSIAGVGHDE